MAISAENSAAQGAATANELSYDPNSVERVKPYPVFARIREEVNHVASPVCTFATATLSLAEVKETGKHLGVTFNDVVLAVAAGGLRELLLRYDGRADRPIMATVPVSTDRSTDRLTGNEIGGIMVSLPLHVDDPLQRVKLTSMATARAKERQRSARAHVAGQDTRVPAATAGAGDVPRNPSALTTTG